MKDQDKTSLSHARPNMVSKSLNLKRNYYFIKSTFLHSVCPRLCNIGLGQLYQFIHDFYSHTDTVQYCKTQ